MARRLLQKNSCTTIEGAVDPEVIVKKGQRIIPLRLFWWSLVSIIELVAMEGIYFDGITLSIIGIFDAVAAGKANTQMTDDIYRQSLRDIVVQPGRPYEGLVYFQGTPMRIRLTYRQGGATKQVELPWR